MSIEHKLVDTIDFENVINDLANQKARFLNFCNIFYQNLML